MIDGGEVGVVPIVEMARNGFQKWLSALGVGVSSVLLFEGGKRPSGRWGWGSVCSEEWAVAG